MNKLIIRQMLPFIVATLILIAFLLLDLNVIWNEGIKYSFNTQCKIIFVQLLCIVGSYYITYTMSLEDKTEKKFKDLKRIFSKYKPSFWLYLDNGYNLIRSNTVRGYDINYKYDIHLCSTDYNEISIPILDIIDYCLIAIRNSHVTLILFCKADFYDTTLNNNDIRIVVITLNEII